LPVILLIAGAFVWLNHFDNAFHDEDFNVIVNNRQVADPANLLRFFTNPLTSNLEPEFARYHPLAMFSLGLDAKISGVTEPGFFQFDGFMWYSLLIFGAYLLFRLLPGSHHDVALFATALVGFHPLAAETLNYISQRGILMSSAGVVVAFLLWIVWPHKLPRALGFNMNRVPQNWWQDWIRQHGEVTEERYQKFLRFPMPLYLLVLIPALLADSSAAVFAPLLIVYLLIFDAGGSMKRVIVPSVICGAAWIANTAVDWRYSPLFRIPAALWAANQPWLAARYLFRFFVPVGLSPVPDTAISWNFVQIGIGVIVIGALVAAALRLGRNEQWRSTAFGIWWFLIALLPWALVPQRSPEAYPRMLLAMAGIALAFASLVHNLVARRPAAQMAAAILGCLIVGMLGWTSHQRNVVWATEESLWEDAIHASPKSAAAFVNYGMTMVAQRERARATVNFEQATPLAKGNAPIEVRLALGFDRLLRDTDTEYHFRQALQDAPEYSAAYAYFGQWLMGRQRSEEALEMSKKAAALNSGDLVSRHTLIDLYTTLSDWPSVEKFARQALDIDPEDPAGQRAMRVVAASNLKLEQAEKNVKGSKNVDDFLALSVLYYNNRRYQDCINAAAEAVKIRPELAEGYANMATAYHAMGKDDEAILNLRQVIHLRPDMKFAQVDLDILLEQKSAAMAAAKAATR
jgi:tetratricopeptide (TPR) repeat protein